MLLKEAGLADLIAPQTIFFLDPLRAYNGPVSVWCGEPEYLCSDRGYELGLEWKTQD